MSFMEQKAITSRIYVAKFSSLLVGCYMLDLPLLRQEVLILGMSIYQAALLCQAQKFTFYPCGSTNFL